ncbi:MAG: hypothetical protein ACR2GX_03620 [Candidatus Dormibacteria bacterium]
MPDESAPERRPPKSEVSSAAPVRRQKSRPSPCSCRRHAAGRPRCTRLYIPRVRFLV